jgi:hypothetical protein
VVEGGDVLVDQSRNLFRKDTCMKYVHQTIQSGSVYSFNGSGSRDDYFFEGPYNLICIVCPGAAVF